MAGSRVVILSSHSLFVEGVASRLRQHLAAQDVQTVDARHTEALQLVIAAQPSVIILDATDAEVTRNCPLEDLLQVLPALKVIRLDPQTNRVQVVTSEQRFVGEVRDLIDMIERKAIHRKEEKRRLPKQKAKRRTPRAGKPAQVFSKRK